MTSVQTFERAIELQCRIEECAKTISDEITAVLGQPAFLVSMATAPIFAPIVAMVDAYLTREQHSSSPTKSIGFDSRYFHLFAAVLLALCTAYSLWVGHGWSAVFLALGACVAVVHMKAVKTGVTD